MFPLPQSEELKHGEYLVAFSQWYKELEFDRKMCVESPVLALWQHWYLINFLEGMRMAYHTMTKH